MRKPDARNKGDMLSSIRSFLSAIGNRPETASSASSSDKLQKKKAAGKRIRKNRKHSVARRVIAKKTAPIGKHATSIVKATRLRIPRPAASKKLLKKAVPKVSIKPALYSQKHPEPAGKKNQKPAVKPAFHTSKHIEAGGKSKRNQKPASSLPQDVARKQSLNRLAPKITVKPQFYTQKHAEPVEKKKDKKAGQKSAISAVQQFLRQFAPKISAKPPLSVQRRMGSLEKTKPLQTSSMSLASKQILKPLIPKTGIRSASHPRETAELSGENGKAVQKPATPPVPKQPLPKKEPPKQAGVMYKPAKEEPPVDKREWPVSLEKGGKGQKQAEKPKPPQFDRPIFLETNVDRLYAIIQAKGSMDMGEAARQFRVTEQKVEDWCRMLEDHGMIEIHYPPFGKAQIRLKQTEKKSEPQAS